MPYLDVDSKGKVRIFGGEFENDKPWKHTHEFAVLPEAPYMSAFLVLIILAAIFFVHCLRVDFTNCALFMSNGVIADVNFSRPWFSRTVYISGDVIATIIFDTYFTKGATVICGPYKARGKLDENGNFVCFFFKIVNVKKTSLII